MQFHANREQRLSKLSHLLWQNGLGYWRRIVVRLVASNVITKITKHRSIAIMPMVRSVVIPGRPPFNGCYLNLQVSEALSFMFTNVCNFIVMIRNV